VSTSDCFLKHLHTYQCFRAIADLLAAHRGPKTRASLDTNQGHPTGEDEEQTPIVVLPSSTELFYVYGQTLEGCATLSTGRPLFDLLEVFKKWLRVYAGKHGPRLGSAVIKPYCVCRGSALATDAPVRPLILSILVSPFLNETGYQNTTATSQICGRETRYK
jgi:hypothetical protein